ncbi:hypothetical protein [uncultured Dokdonia sp.]|uniref:hypothetical protein n=1 Tax=uncultured Dokdonia sp. TaxID=575653 RepID=UPI00262C07FC|nr:hypothetical protein [uncultured Dokdonia sp.]
MFSESFKTDLTDNQIIPLILEVFDKLEWIVVFTDKKSIEAKRKNSFNKPTEKITVTKSNSGQIKVHSKTIDTHFWDVGRNSLRTGLFIAVFKKLATEYKASGKIIELTTEYENHTNWADYEIPPILPKPKPSKKPNLTLTLLGGILISIIIGLTVGFLTQTFVYFIGVYELIIGLVIGYLFSNILKETNYVDYSRIQIMIGGIAIGVFLISLYTQYYIIITEERLLGITFFEFIKLRVESGLMIKTLNTGPLGLILSWILQITLPFFIAQSKVAINLMSYSIEKIPEKVMEYAVYLLENNKSESEIRAELSAKGWNKKEDQDNVFEAIGSINSFQLSNRE